MLTPRLLKRDFSAPSPPAALLPACAEATEGELDLLQSVLATTTAYSPSPAAAAAAAESEPAAAGSVPSVEGAQGQQPGDARAAPEHTNAAPRQEGAAAVVSRGKNRTLGAERHSAGNPAIARPSG